MAFAARQPAQANVEENAAAVKDAAARAGKQSLLQQGSKRRAPLGDMSNLHGPLNGRPAAGKEAAKVAEPVKSSKQTTTRGPSKDGSAQGAQARVGVTTRSQSLAIARQQVQGPSMTSLLQARSEQAVSTQKPAHASSVLPESPLPTIDTPADSCNPLAATDYVNDIYSYFRRIEPRFRVQYGYMARQVDINDRMRAILIDWLVEVHLKFKLMPETLYLTVNLIDRFLELKPVTRKNLQLVGVTAMLIGSKYEEIWAPEVRDFVYISDKAYTRDQILAMEKLMLNTLQFNLTLPTCHQFLARFIKAACPGPEQKKVLTLATYLAELSLVDAGMLAYSYSQISAASIYVAMRALEMPDPYPHALARHAGYTCQSLLPCSQALVKLMQKAPTNSLGAVYKKYCSPKQMEVGLTAPPTDILCEPLGPA